MATPMPLKLEFGGDAARAVPGVPAVPSGPGALPQPGGVAGVALNGSVAAGLGSAHGASALATAGASGPAGASAFSSPLSLEEEEMRAHDLKFGYYGHEYQRQHPGKHRLAPPADLESS